MITVDDIPEVATDISLILRNFDETSNNTEAILFAVVNVIDQDENNVITITGDDASEFSVQDKFIYLLETDLSIGQTLEYKINVIATDKVDSNIRFSESMIITIELNASKIIW